MSFGSFLSMEACQSYKVYAVSIFSPELWVPFIGTPVIYRLGSISEAILKAIKTAYSVPFGAYI